MTTSKPSQVWNPQIKLLPISFTVNLQEDAISFFLPKSHYPIFLVNLHLQWSMGCFWGNILSVAYIKWFCWKFTEDWYLYLSCLKIKEYNLQLVLRLTASSRGYTFLPIFVTFWDAPNQPNKCNSYAEGFAIDDIQTWKYDICNSSGLASIAYSSFLSILKNCLRYKSVPYLMQSVWII